jgi:hypothetical protein
MVLLTQSALATEFKFTRQAAEQLAGELQYCKETTEYNDKLVTILNLKVDKYFTLSNEYKTKIELLDKDKVDLRLRGDQFEKVYTTCTSDLNDCKQAKPSRLVWYGAGVITTLVLGLATVFMIKK